ncbi:MAG: hypothetical protein HY917_02445 [Candidatus Diapherotrites archaeon]|nr:hypothetical protein [Candidatus Diapherotrites archaeon]
MKKNTVRLLAVWALLVIAVAGVSAVSIDVPSQEEVDQLKTQQTDMNSRLSALETQLTQLEETLNTLAAQQQELSAQLNQTTSQLQGVDGNLSYLQGLERTVMEMQQSQDELRLKTDALNAQLNQEKKKPAPVGFLNLIDFGLLPIILGILFLAALAVLALGFVRRQNEPSLSSYKEKGTLSFLSSRDAGEGLDGDGEKKGKFSA